MVLGNVTAKYLKILSKKTITFVREPRAPTSSDKVPDNGYSTIWINTATDDVYMFTTAANNSANWTLLGTFAANTVTGTSQTLANQNSYISANAALTTFTLPATAAVGDTFLIIGKGAGFWTIAQNAGQSIHYNASTTTVGVGGSITSTQAYNTMTIQCTVANTEFTVISASGAAAAYTIV